MKGAQVAVVLAAGFVRSAVGLDFDYSDEGASWTDGCADQQVGQSPINIVDIVEPEEALSFHYHTEGVYRHWNMSRPDGGVSFQVEPYRAEYVDRLHFDGSDYYLQYYRVHAPSEHTFAGASRDVEIQLVHKNSADKYAILSLFWVGIDGGREDEFLTNVAEALIPEYPMFNVVECPHVRDICINPSFVLPSDYSADYLTYTGSFTSPANDCAGDVQWFLSQVPTVTSTSFLTSFVALPAQGQHISPTARKVQPAGPEVSRISVSYSTWDAAVPKTSLSAIGLTVLFVAALNLS